MNHDDKIISIKVIIIIIAFQNDTILKIEFTNSFIPVSIFFLHSRKWHVRPNETILFYSFKYHRSDDISRCDRPKRICRIRQIDDNERVRHSLVNCTVKNRRSRETGLGKSKLGVLPPHWWEVVSFMLKQHILRGSAASKIGERCRRIS